MKKIDSSYQVLGVCRQTDGAQIRARYRSLASQMHPDRQGGNEADFAQLSVAFANLRDERCRADYDAALALFTQPCDGCDGDGARWRQVGFSRVAEPCEKCGGCGRLGASS